MRFLSDIAMGRFDDNASSCPSRRVVVSGLSSLLRRLFGWPLCAPCRFSLGEPSPPCSLLSNLASARPTVSSPLCISSSPTSTTIPRTWCFLLTSPTVLTPYIGMSCSTTSTPVAISMGFGGWRIGVMAVLLSWSSHRPRALRLSPPLAELVKAVLLAPCSSRSPCNPSSSTWFMGSLAHSYRYRR